jgi:signal transduction histidine kinase
MGVRIGPFQIIVADDGVGAPPVNEERLFEPFFTTKGDPETKLGLWVVQGIVTGSVARFACAVVSFWTRAVLAFRFPT